MPKIKAVVVQTGTKGKRWWAKLDRKIENKSEFVGGFGSTPEEIMNAFTDGIEIEIPYHINGEFVNYGEPKEPRGDQPVTQKTPVGDLAAVIKALTMPKITVGFEKTVQEAQYEPKKASVFISFNVEEFDPEKVRDMLTAAEGEVMAKLTKFRPASKSQDAKTFMPEAKP